MLASTIALDRFDPCPAALANVSSRRSSTGLPTIWRRSAW